MPIPQWGTNTSGAAGGDGAPNDDIYYFYTAFPYLCSIMRATETADGHGGMERTWAAAVENVKCSIDGDSGATEIIEGGAVRSVTTFKINFELRTDLRPGDRIELGAISDQYGYTPAQTFEVIDTDVGRAHQNCLEAVCRRIRRGDE